VGLPTIGGSNALLLFFKDGSRLPLRLNALPDGPNIMIQLQEKLKERLVLNYKYSAEEKRQLYVADINELIPN
jgi:hypothetical protein